MKNMNPGVAALICGIVSNVLNCIMTIIMFLSDRFMYGGIFIIVPVCGIVSAARSLKLFGANPLAIISLVLNIIGTLGAAGFILIAFVGKIFG